MRFLFKAINVGEKKKKTPGRPQTTLSSVIKEQLKEIGSKSFHETILKGQDRGASRNGITRHVSVYMWPIRPFKISVYSTQYILPSIFYPKI